MLVSNVQQSESVIRIYLSMFFFRFFFIIGYYKILSTMLYSRFLLFTYIIYSSVYVFILYS